jgi:3-deoxy-manno-octulosonate cytidylyltransferase (CMP-KDO synthetase)
MTLGIIPARYASTRFPGKPLALIGGKTMIQRVCEQVQQADLVSDFLVATDDERIASHVSNLGFRVERTRADHPSGTDRCAEVARRYPDYRLVVNIQGDEPFIQPEQIDLLVASMQGHPDFTIGTLAKRIYDVAQIQNPNVVKTVFSDKAGALYFSRQPIPHLRHPLPESIQDHSPYFKHIGMYAFTRDALLEVSELPPARLEQLESLEQLRWLENGFRILVVETQQESHGVDTPNDLLRWQ